MLSAIDGDDPRLRDALLQAGLPPADTDEPASFFALIDAAGAIAFGGIAGNGADRLLRSVVVPEEMRSSGIGSRIVALIADEAKRDGAGRLWLLTNDAAGFFERLGWRCADRAAAPDASGSRRNSHHSARYPQP